MSRTIQEPVVRVERGPRRYSAAELAKVGVTLTDRERRIMRCDTCGQGWLAMLRAGGHFYRGWWRCPNDCNRPAE